jgi:hypothetical protein
LCTFNLDNKDKIVVEGEGDIVADDEEDEVVTDDERDGISIVDLSSDGNQIDLED